MNTDIKICIFLKSSYYIDTIQKPKIWHDEIISTHLV